MAGRYDRLPLMVGPAARGARVRRAPRGAGGGPDQPRQRWAGTCPDDRVMAWNDGRSRWLAQHRAAVDPRLHTVGLAHDNSGRPGMKLGVIVPQGWTHEFDGWEPNRRGRARSRSRSRRIGSDSSRSGSTTTSTPFRSRPMRSPSSRSPRCGALAALTERVRLGQIVICNGFRNPALTAKMASMLDTISAGASSSASAQVGSATSGSPTGTAFRRPRFGSRCFTTRSRSSRACWSQVAPRTPRSRGSTTVSATRINVPKPVQRDRHADHGGRQRAERDLAPGSPLCR